ncbi:hypothetical protein BHM03_00015627 [Ensete ventricosum]|nr:hypothetical protein BHM03_00015627 [Ensete ventricosum]
MLRPSVTREWVGEGELPRERTKIRDGGGPTMYDRSDRRVGLFSDNICLREPDKSEEKAEGGTSVESLIPCSHRGRALVVKGAEEVENAEANSKYQDRAEGAKELHKTGVDGLLIKIAKSEGLRVDAGVLDQGTE